MKKCLLITLALLMAATMLYAGDNNSNISTGYLRVPVRNSVMNNLDATIFNPAGTTELEDGFHIGIQNEILLRNYSYDATTLMGGAVVVPDGESDDNTYLLPTVMLDYTRNNWSAFATLTVPGGGGTISYEPLVKVNQGVLATGTPNTTFVDADLKASSMILGYTLGGAYKFFDMVSVSGAVRMLQAKATTELSLAGTTMKDTEEKAFGVGGIFGINVMPLDGLNIAMRYETPVKMEYDASGTGASDYRHDFPALFGLGVGYQVIPSLRLMADFGYNFYKLQAEESEKMAKAGVNKDDVKDGWTIALGAEYDITERILVSAGVCYTNSGVNDDTAAYSSVMAVAGTPTAVPLPNPNPDLGRTTIGMGGQFEVIEDLNLELGYMLVLYRGEEDKNGIDYSKKVHGFSLGAAYHF